MSFISLTFLIFFVSVLVFGKILQRSNNSKIGLIFLLICNYIFYSYWDIRFSILLFVLTIIVYYCGLHIDNKKIFLFGILTSLLILCFFKYFNFFLSALNLDTLNIILPIGISFYTFEAISYLVDIKRCKIEPEKNFIVFASYISFFPNIVSGPICRASNLLKQIKENRKIELNNILIGIQIMAIGYFKKMVIADRLNVFTTDVFYRSTAFNWYTTLLAVISYSIQIYMDFSGYSDIAIGCAKCLGYDLTINFDLPYISKSITEFWRRWHISLSSWFKDYVYIPLGGNRKGKTRQLINLLIVMSLSGLWHGANWNYVIWGLINGLLLCFEKLFINKQRKENFLNWLFTFLLISFSWIFFRAENMSDALHIIISIFTFKDGISQPYLWSFLLILVVILTTLRIVKNNKKNTNDIYKNYLIQDLSTIKGLTLFFMLLGLIICFAYTNTSPFVYFQF